MRSPRSLSMPMQEMSHFPSLRGASPFCHFEQQTPAVYGVIDGRNSLQLVGPDPRSGLLGRSGIGPYIFRPVVLLFIRSTRRVRGNLYEARSPRYARDDSFFHRTREPLNFMEKPAREIHAGVKFATEFLSDRKSTRLNSSHT